MQNQRKFLGVDVGSSFIKCAVIDEKCGINGSSTVRTVSDISASINRAIEEASDQAGSSEVWFDYITATGFGRRKVSRADSIKTEISCHAKGVFHYFPRKVTIIDIGGQDTKIIKLDEEGKRTGFKMNRKCAAGTGSFLEEVANRLNVPLGDMNALAGKSTVNLTLGSFCTVFASTEVLNRVKDGERLEDMAKSVYDSIARRVLEMERFEGSVVVTGGVVAHNDILVEILENLIGQKVMTPPDPQQTGAFGAALFAREDYK